jgi:site-specific DNA-methyltransferase (adenine-specific)
MIKTVIYHGDCLVEMDKIPDHSVDMILCDLPYGTTACKWDVIIPFEPLWEHYWRVLKKNGAAVLFGSQPFSSILISSEIKKFKYEWIWEKGRASGFVHAKNKPMKAHENILVFSQGTTIHANQSSCRMTYNPQMECGKPYKRLNTSTTKTGNLAHAPSKANLDYVGTVVENSGTRYPRSVQFFSHHNVGNFHPTQKPVNLLEYLIKTYTNEGETVLDNCMGSGSTGVACVNTNRNFIGIEKEEKYFNIAKDRIDNSADICTEKI